MKVKTTTTITTATTILKQLSFKKIFDKWNSNENLSKTSTNGKRLVGTLLEENKYKPVIVDQIRHHALKEIKNKKHGRLFDSNKIDKLILAL